MRNFIDKFEKFVDKIGKPNFILIVFILFFIAVTGLYQTFSLFTSSGGMANVDGVKTYQFILNSDISENTLTIPANSSRKFHVTIDNEEDIPLKYGVYYSSSDLSSISLGYLSYSTYKANGVIEAKGSYEISFGIDNNSDNNVSIKIGVSYGLENGGDLVLDNNNHWFSLYNSFLNEMPSGSYVKYVGNNGCTDKSCEGQNANYVSDTDMGYCVNSSYKFNSNGWRIAYVKDGTAYLTSAGSPECMCTSSDGTAGTSCSSSESTSGVPKHLANLNAKALTYCNSTYAYGGKCDSNSAWNMADADFKTITGDTLSTAYSKSNGSYDSYSIINNGGFYWLATPYSASPVRSFFWRPINRNVAYTDSSGANGIRPVIRLAETVKINGGSGTYEDPYTIVNYPFSLSEVEAGSYVEYTGNNGCSGKSCEGQNANYKSDTDMGYCSSSSYKYNANGWRVAYVKDGSAYLTSAGSPECMCTNSNGNALTSCSSSESTSGVPKHLANLNAKALTYCNSTYAYGGKCNSNSAWNMADADFQAITGDTLSTAYNKSNYNNYSLINNGGFYWFATPYSSSITFAFRWIPSRRYVARNSSDDAIGVRPVLRLASSVVVTGGAGTYQDPYKIEVKETKLSDVEAGSYVEYTGNNGCSGKACEGQNANYVSDTDMGYCSSSSYKFNANGWRVAYTKDDTAYLTSAGSPECMCTNSSGTASTSCSSYESTDGLPKHIANLNTKALTYCNSIYAYGGKCDSNSTWNMANADFQTITGDTLSVAYNKSNYNNYSLINNGGFYWFSSTVTSSSKGMFAWLPDDRRVYGNYSSLVYGIRPVLRLASSVSVTGGSGTYEDPYTISNGETKLSEVKAGSYVKYTGNNGCSGKACEGQNANYVSDTDMGYCFNSSDKFNANGWIVAYTKDGTAYLTSAGSPECMCTDSSGTAGTSCSNWEATDGVPKHIANLNSKALTYCNSTYAYESKCDSNSAWNMKSSDFKNITGENMSSLSSSSSSIINNGGHYWFASDCTSSTPRACIWSKSIVDGNNSSALNGIRPVLRIRSSVIVTGGSGTYKDPYIIQ